MWQETADFSKIIIEASPDIMKHDNALAAKAVKLLYVNDKQTGITRVKKGDKFEYEYKGTVVTDEDTLARIKSIVIPPAWEHVWICRSANGHIQVTGIDTKGRKQYRYHPRWVALRNQSRFFSLYDFGKVIPSIREALNKHMSLPGMPREKVLATIVSLMERTHIRIGNASYEKAYGSVGLSTMSSKHVKIDKTAMRFKFVGKKGVAHDITIRSKKLANIVQNCKDIPGKELFHYYDEQGNIYPIDSGDVNDYIKQISGKEFTSKDFRTWHGSVKCLVAFKTIGPAENMTQTKKNVVAALDLVATQLGNTRTVCKKHYVHPLVITCYEDGCLGEFIKHVNGMELPMSYTDLTPEEKALMKMLKLEMKKPAVSKHASHKKAA